MSRLQHRAASRSTVSTQLALLAIALLVLLAAGRARAGTAWVYARGAQPARVLSLRELRFRGVIEQQYDYSCGAAAVATLLSHHLETPTPEAHVFANMLANGEAERIVKVGFSLLDMKRYLRARGFEADGFKVPLAKLQEGQIPAIALIDQQVNKAVYKHFVVIKGITDDRVLLADSSAGLRMMDRAEFERIRDPVLLVVRSHLELARKHFQGEAEGWQLRPRVKDRSALETADLGTAALMLPRMNEF
jgi:uncharacterized protein